MKRVPNSEKREGIIMKIGVSSYSFNRLMKDGKADLLELPAIASKMGYEAI